MSRGGLSICFGHCIVERAHIPVGLFERVGAGHHARCSFKLQKTIRCCASNMRSRESCLVDKAVGVILRVRLFRAFLLDVS